jgi:type 1 fimbriae regulatory protein FimB/type 1 fimbriae regulatory protein FimE
MASGRARPRPHARPQGKERHAIRPSYPRGDEIRALRKLRRESPTEASSSSRSGKAAKMPFPLHPHMLRHACGYKLANDGHDTRALQHYLDHKNIQHTVRYTELSPDRFRDFWRD